MTKDAGMLPADAGIESNDKSAEERAEKVAQMQQEAVETIRQADAIPSGHWRNPKPGFTKRFSGI